MVSEKINGREHRQQLPGLIYLSYDLKRDDVAGAFAELSIHFATYIDGESKDFERSMLATGLCHSIKAELGL